MPVAISDARELTGTTGFRGSKVWSRVGGIHAELDE